MEKEEKSFEQQLEEAKINYSPIYKISGEVFTQTACEILNIPIERMEVRRHIGGGGHFGTLTVYVYLENDEDKQYYHFENGATHYEHLSPNIDKFKKELKEGKGLYIKSNK